MTAEGVSGTTLCMLEEKSNTGEAVDQLVHQTLLSLFFVYLIVGGRPDAVKTYIETKDIREVDKIQKDIILQYRENTPGMRRRIENSD